MEEIQALEGSTPIQEKEQMLVIPFALPALMKQLGTGVELVKSFNPEIGTINLDQKRKT